MMNIQPGGTQRRKTSRRSAAAPSGSGVFGNWITAVCKAALLLGVIAALFHAYISLNQQIGTTDRAVERTKKEIVAVEREISLIRNQYASRCSEAYISRQIQRFNLPLVSPLHGQMRRMTLLTPLQASRVVYPAPRVRSVAVENGRGTRAVRNGRFAAGN